MKIFVRFTSFKNNADISAYAALRVKQSYCFTKLPHHLTQVYPDAMHTVKDCIECIFLLIGKSNLDAIKNCEISFCRFYVNTTTRKTKRMQEDIRKHPYVLTSDELELADKRSKSIVMPDHDFKPNSIFYRTTNLKSHDWKEVYTFDMLIYVFCIEVCTMKPPIKIKGKFHGTYHINHGCTHIFSKNLKQNHTFSKHCILS